MLKAVGVDVAAGQRRVGLDEVGKLDDLDAEPLASGVGLDDIEDGGLWPGGDAYLDRLQVGLCP
jgi:hypothetical protein